MIVLRRYGFVNSKEVLFVRKLGGDGGVKLFILIRFYMVCDVIDDLWI